MIIDTVLSTAPPLEHKATSLLPAAAPNKATSVPIASKEISNSNLPPLGYVGCTSIPQTNGTMIVLCRPEKPLWWETAIGTAPSLFMSLLAVSLSFWSFFYTRSKDAKARRQSIQDDFWLRKVISPISIEPFVKYTTDLRNALAQVEITSTAEDVESLWSNLSIELSQLNAGFQLLELVDETLTPKIQVYLDVIDDELATYFGKFIAARKQHDGVFEPNSSDECLIKIDTAQKTIFRLIHSHQSAMGNTKDTSWFKKLKYLAVRCSPVKTNLPISPH